MAMKLLDDYGFIRGICHNPRKDRSKEQTEFELQCAQRLQINSTRFWMLQEEWEKDRDGYIALIRDFMETCWKYGINSMPIFWNGNFIVDFKEPTEEEWAVMEEYAKDIINEFKDEPYILMWDVINEPMCNDYIRKCTGEIYEERFAKLTKYVRRMCEIVRRLDPVTPITVGHEQVRHCVSSVDLVDVICFHDYLGTRKTIEGFYKDVKELAAANGNKPIMNTETGCIGRANPYDIELELCEKYNYGWYLFNLVSEGFWGDIHGLIYPDGTIRDPAVIAAIFGFYRNRTPQRILPSPNKEGHAYKAIQAVKDVLGYQETTLFMKVEKTTDDILEAAEYCVNILESCEMVPMFDPPSAKIQCWRAQPEAERDEYAIKKFAYDMMKTLEAGCLI